MDWCLSSSATQHCKRNVGVPGKLVPASVDQLSAAEWYLTKQVLACSVVVAQMRDLRPWRVLYSEAKKPQRLQVPELGPSVVIIVERVCRCGSVGLQTLVLTK